MSLLTENIMEEIVMEEVESNRCERCHGLCREDKMIGVNSVETESLVFSRCINCGDILDPTILKNRVKRPEVPMRVLPRIRSFRRL